MNCPRGEVVLVLFPDSNRQTAWRPPRVVQAIRLDGNRSQPIVAMNTGNMAGGGYPSTVIVTAGSETEKESGLLMDRRIMTNNLASIHDSEIDRATPQTWSAF